MKRSSLLFAMLPLILALALACNLSSATSNPAPASNDSGAGEISATPTAEAPPDSSSKKTSAPPTAGPTSTNTLTATTAFTGAMPGDPPAKIAYVDDISEKSKNGENGAAGGDNFAENIYERPFNKDMSYRLDLDISGTTFSKDANWFYVTIALGGQNPTNGKMSANYGVEFDVNKDGRGEFVVWTVPDFSTQWTRTNTKIFGTSTNMVGGTHPSLSDAPSWTGATYDKVLFDGATDNQNNGAWVRVSPTNANNMEIAVNSMMISAPAQFLWGVWADDGIKDPTKFDYNDVITKAEAGSPYKSLADFPPKAIWSVDNTCRYWVGFSPDKIIPGSCYVPPPTKTPIPTKTPTKTLLRGPD
jgi:hypothetical protein